MPAGTHASGQVPKTPRLKNAAPQKVFEAQLPPPARGHPVAPAAARQECTGCPATAKLQVRRPKVWHGAPAACTFRHRTSSGQPVQHVRLSATEARLPDMLCCTRLLGVQHYSQMMDTMLDMALPGAQRTRCGSGPRSTASSAKWPDPERSVLRDKQKPCTGLASPQAAHLLRGGLLALELQVAPHGRSAASVRWVDVAGQRQRRCERSRRRHRRRRAWHGRQRLRSKAATALDLGAGARNLHDLERCIAGSTTNVCGAITPVSQRVPMLPLCTGMPHAQHDPDCMAPCLWTPPASSTPSLATSSRLPLSPALTPR